MWNYARKNWAEWWVSLRGDIVLAILGLIAAYIASQYDCKLINISRFPFSTNELVIGIYFVIIIAIVLAIIYSYYLILL